MKTNTLNMTEGSILGKMARFTLPIILGNLLQELYTVVDTLIVGRTLGVDKLAAVGAAGCLTFSRWASSWASPAAVRFSHPSISAAESTMR